MLNKPFFELVNDVLNLPDTSIDCKYFSCQSTHFVAKKQKENVEAIISKGINPKENQDCKMAKMIITDILKEIEKL